MFNNNKVATAGKSKITIQLHMLLHAVPDEKKRHKNYKNNYLIKIISVFYFGIQVEL